MNNHLSDFVRTKIIVLHEQNVPNKAIARQLGISVITVRLWVNRYAMTGDIKAKQTGPRPWVLTSERHQQIVNTHSHSPFASTSVTAQQHGVSPVTVRRHLHAANIHNYKPARKIELTETHRRERLRFAEEYLNFDWQNNIVIFTDEKTFRSDTDGRKILWRKPNQRFLPQNILPVRASGRITLGYWGWMSSMGPGELVEIDGRMNGEQYVEVLKEVMLPTVRVVYPVGHIYFVQDNCAVHRSRIVTEWLSTQNDMTVIPWPSKSPDLNPIENMWGLKVLNWDSDDIRSKCNLRREVLRSWDKMRGSDAGWNMVSQMKSRLEQIIQSEGYPIRY